MPANQTAFLHLDPDRTVQPNRVTDAYNTLPPGGHIAVLSTPTKYHLNTSRIEVAGFEIRDCVHVDTGPHHFLITIARKPLDGTVLNTPLQHHAGAMRIDAVRVPPAGRWPANTILRHTDTCERTNETPTTWHCAPNCPVTRIDQQSGTTVSTGGRIANISKTSRIYGGGKGLGQDLDPADVKGDPGYGDRGGASRYFTTMTPDTDHEHALRARPNTLLGTNTVT